MPLPEHPEELSEFCITDIGSTTTKAILFVREGSEWRYHRRESETTVEKPHEDVTIGVENAFQELQVASGRNLWRDKRPTIPYLSTSSAGGGLAMVVTGLVRDVTSTSAERVALGAGAIVLDIIAMDDGRTPYEKIEVLKTLRPDMVLLAGGFDGSAISGPVFLAELIREARLRPKLSTSAHLPIVYAGNVFARDFVRETLGDSYMFHPVDNLRPASERENLEPSHQAIHDLFMDHVMSQAPGYEQLTSLVDAPIIPTPSAFSKILELASREMDLRILAIDIGGATTDVFSAHKGSVFRTVSANLGMSYSIMQVMERTNERELMALTGLELFELWDGVGNKHIHPTGLPMNAQEQEIEWAVAAMAIREAVRDHLRVLRGVSISRGKQDLSFMHGLDSRKRKIKAVENGPFRLTDYDLIIGSGGILSHSPRDAAAMMLINGLHPQGEAVLAVDSAFMIPHLGSLADHAPRLALRLFQELGMVRLGTVITISGHLGESETGRVKGRSRLGRTIDEELPAGGVHTIPLDCDDNAAVKIHGFARLGTRRFDHLTGGACGIIIDSRVTPGEKDDFAGRRGPLRLEETPHEILRVDLRAPDAEALRRGKISLRRELVIPGTVYVTADQLVTSQTVIARSQRQFLRPFFLDVTQALNLPPAEIQPYLKVAIGDRISVDDLLAERVKNRFSIKRYRSPVAGIIERLLPSGTLVVRETPEQAAQMGTAPVARDLRIRPEQMKPYLRVSEGDSVNKGQWIASIMRPPDIRFSAAPVRGTVKEISHKYGVVFIEPLHEELEIKAWLPGLVSDVSNMGCVITASGIEISGRWGCGGESVGVVTFDKPEQGAALIRDTATMDDLTAVTNAGGTGLITGSIRMSDVRTFKPSFSLVVLQGFGSDPMPEVFQSLFRSHEGSLVLLDGTTELRVGVRRPRIILPEPV